MRWLFALGLAAALASCSVDTEGAACPTPGLPDGCPGGQRCGAGRTCSAAAMGCEVCTPGVRQCRDGAVKSCTAATDPICGSWSTVDPCQAGVTTCGSAVGSSDLVCRCVRFVVDPAGAAVPTACRFAAVSGAIVEARRFDVSEVFLGGAPGQDYGAAAADAAPLRIPAGVAVVGDDLPLDRTARVLQVRGSGADAVVLEAGASLAGLTVRRGAGDVVTGIHLEAGSPPGRASLTAVDVDAAGAGGGFPRGLFIEGAGAVGLVDVAVRGTTSAALDVIRASIDEPVTATDLLVDGEATAAAAVAGQGNGINLSTGDLMLVRPVVKRCGGVGLMAGFGGPGQVRLDLQGAKVHHNFGTGVVAQFVDDLAVAGAKVCKNQGGATRNLDGTSRVIGGVFLGGAAPAVQSFSGLWVTENDGDQVGIGPDPSTWNLAGPSGQDLACGGGVNVFLRSGPGFYGLATAGNVDASWNAWRGSAPVLGTDVLKIKTPTVILGSEPPNSNYCSLPLDLTCPAP